MKESNYKRKVVKNVIKNSVRFAKSLSLLENSVATDGLNKVSVEMEWFLTWAIKLSERKQSLWCDGVIDLQFIENTNEVYSFNCNAWLGPEHNVNLLFKCKMSGLIGLSESGAMETYYFNIKYQDEEVVVEGSI